MKAATTGTVTSDKNLKFSYKAVKSFGEVNS